MATTTPNARRKSPKKKPDPKLLSGGNPQIAKGDGDAPVQQYIAAMPGWKREVGQWFDALVVARVPAVRKAVKWNSPLYGLDGKGWFASVHVFTRFVRVTFFKGARLEPAPSGASKVADVRYFDVYEDDPRDEAQIASWIDQASKLDGWTP
ncbi:MAG: DUF1801 domain-containing protein [Polyangiales bacterium]